MSLHQDEDDKYEEEYVHEVYQQIASHFSSTRYKAWPIIEQFLKGLPDGSVGLDIGCGNGKYLAVNPNIFIVGSDRSKNLVTIAKRHQPHSVLAADIFHLPHTAGSFDFVICIAVVHHLSTNERRRKGIESILACLNQSGQALIFVWALEQGGSRRGWTEQDSQDVMVPWVMRGSKKTTGERTLNGVTRDAQPSDDKVFHRYYHLYAQGELESDIIASGGSVTSSGYEKDNWWAIARKLSD